MNKELERMLVFLHGEYPFTPVVGDRDKQWWFEVAYKYLIDYLRCYAQFEPEIVDNQTERT